MLLKSVPKQRKAVKRKAISRWYYLAFDESLVLYIYRAPGGDWTLRHSGERGHMPGLSGL